MLIQHRNQHHHLSFCTNIFPHDSWKETKQAIVHSIPEIKRWLITGDEWFGIGLRLSAKAAYTLVSHAEEREWLCSWLRENRCYIFTINGFPYGPFHGQPVKEKVYAPDWNQQQRLAYTNDLISLLGEFLPEDVTYGSISTMPVSFDRTGPHENAIRHLMEAVWYCHRVEIETGRCIRLAIEPEPHCFLGSLEEAVNWYDPEKFVEQAEGWKVSKAMAISLIRRHLGFCVDLCHNAVEFESPVEMLVLLSKSEGNVYKVQISS